MWIHAFPGEESVYVCTGGYGVYVLGVCGLCGCLCSGVFEGEKGWSGICLSDCKDEVCDMCSMMSNAVVLYTVGCGK